MPQDQPMEMPFLDHLEELRVRLFWMLGALLVGVLISFWIVLHFDLLTVLQRPIVPFLHGQKLMVTSPGDPIRIVMTASFLLGTIMALPVILYQIWAFLAPGLYQHEKRVMVPVLVGAAALFLAGVSLCYFVVLPMALRFMLGIQGDVFQNMMTAQGYFGFAVNMSLAFGAVFELPIVIMALTALGIVTPDTLARYRRHAIVAILVLSAFVTPPDMISLPFMAIPVYLLFEGSVALSKLIFRNRQKRLAAADMDMPAVED